VIRINYLDVKNDVNLSGPLHLNAEVDFDETLEEPFGLYRTEHSDIHN